ncbi:succinate-semialdehyde dehydrogenase/glutarate-semialdehyde dehydrogenase [Paraburkholderia sp. GAS199]|uniref:NAD-dependent succinate-semialdehyde dehydrogenase n=1 Tax=Paraburkholderia sp. GAS199 TaxID=3035126 RepID=UPI003D2025CD
MDHASHDSGDDIVLDAEVAVHDRLFINGAWVPATGEQQTDLHDPRSGMLSGKTIHASPADLAATAQSSLAGFMAWRKRSAYNRSKLIRAAADLLRERAPEMAALITREQGKPIREAGVEIEAAADLLDWYAEEGRRAYGRIIPPRGPGFSQVIVREPVGPVVAITPTTFPISQAIRKIGPALAAGCSVIVRPPEQTPATNAALAEIFVDAGIPPGVLNLVYGDAKKIADCLVPHPAVRMVTIAGFLSDAKHVAALAGVHMKRSNVELVGHTPAVVMDDADVEMAAKLLAFSKYRNCGQACTAPTHFMIHAGIYDEFKERFIAETRRIQVGGDDRPATNMGPLASAARLDGIQELVDDAIEHGAKLEFGGNRIGTAGYFLQPTVLSEVTSDMRIMSDQLFGPVALLSTFETLDEVIEKSNRLPYGRAIYVFTGSTAVASLLSSSLRAAMISINHLGLELPETPFEGLNDSGFGYEGGPDAIDSYLVTKFISHATL